MNKFVVTNSDVAVFDDQVKEYGGEVLKDSKIVLGPTVWAIVAFDDEGQGLLFSHRVNGTVYNVEWAAWENLRHRVNGGG